MPSWINVTDGIIPAVGKHIVAEDALTGGNESIDIDESADRGVVISTLEIVETRLGVVQLASSAKRRLFQHPRKPWNRSIPGQK